MTRYVTEISWEDTPHLGAAERESLLKAYLPHEREARTMGRISLGAGAIYPVPESDIVCEPFQIPVYYRYVYGLDVGWNRTAAAFFAIDTENDIAYIYSEHYQSAEQPAVHAEAIQSRGRWIPGVIDPAARGRNQTDGQTLLRAYQNRGLTLSFADNSVEAGIYEVWSRLSSGRLKVFSTCRNWLMEFRIYRRDEKGKIVKANDHLMDATRYGVMSGLAVAAMRPRDDWDRMMPGRPRTQHRYEYEPFSEVWVQDMPRPQSPWARR